MLKDFYKLTDDYGSIEIKSNYHNHNYLCGHASGNVCDYAEQAVDNGLDIIGISDHCVPPVFPGAPYVLPDVIDSEYLPQFDKARALYGDKIEILSGVEIEYFEGYDEYYARLLKKVDYLVLGQHEYLYRGIARDSFFDGVDDGNVAAYCNSVAAGCKTGLFSVLAHPDLIFYRNPPVTRKVELEFENMIKTASDSGIAIELNANGIRNHGFRYPTDMLVDLCKKYGAAVVVSADAHSPNCICDEFTLRLAAYARIKGLNVIDRIKHG